MLQFETLEYKNLLSTGSAPIKINLLEAKLTALAGKSGDGKSTVLDAISFVLYGRSYRNINKSQLVNSINKKELLVQLAFNVNGSSYKVTRGISPNVFEIQKDGVDLDSTVVTDQQMFLESIIRMNYKTFKQVVVLGATDFTSFMALKPAERRLLIEKLLDIEVFSIMAKNIASELTETKKDITSVQREILDSENIIRMQEQSLLSIEADEKTVDATIETQIAEFLVKKEKLLTAVKVAPSYDQEKYKKAVDYKTKATSQVSVMESQLRDAKKKLAFYSNTKVCNTCNQDIEQTIKDSVTKECNEAITKLEGEIERAKTNLQKCSKVIAECETIKREIDDVQRHNIKVETALVAIDEAVTKLKSSNQKSLFESSKKKAIETITEYKKKLDNKTIVFNNTSKQKDVLEIAKTIVADDGVKAKIVEQYIPLINKHMNVFLNAMDFFVTFELDSEFNETIKSRGRDSFTYANFSEGEKQRIDLAILLTWRKISQAKNSLSTNLLILDEVFDSYLNHEATENVLDMFKKHFDNSNNIIVISHKESIFDSFERVIKFNKENNFSIIT